LFHDPAGDAYITFNAGDHHETHALNTRAVRQWLSRRFFEEEETAPHGGAVRDAIETLAGFADKGACRPVPVRLGVGDGEVFLDLGDASWRVAHVAAGGWSIIAGDDAPVRFRRPRGLLPLPTPERDGDLSELHDLLNVSDEEFALIVGWELGALNPTGSYPILLLLGEQGSAKTTGGRMLRSLIDPNIAALRRPPTLEDDLLIAAKNGLVVGYDNLSRIPDWLSDALCRLTTGGGLGKRQLFTDVDEVLLDVRRPVLMTGIAAMLTRGDALDRALMVELPEIKKGQRRTEAAVWGDFERARPKLLGLLLTAASTALRTLPTTSIEDLPRMADFALWVEAGASAFGWKAGYFLDAYRANRTAANEITVDASPAGVAVVAFMANRADWSGTATELLAALNAAASETAKPQGWPKRAHTLSAELKRLAPSLRRIGISVDFDRNTKRRTVILTKATMPDDDDPHPSKARAETASSASSASFPHDQADSDDASPENEASWDTEEASSTAPYDDHDAPHDAGTGREASWLQDEISHSHADVEAATSAHDARDTDSSLLLQNALFEGGAVIERQGCGASVNTGQRYCRECDPMGG
jgi:hypothetical protein